MLTQFLANNYFNSRWFEFLLAMTEKEVKARYKHAVLGFLWIVLNPVLQMAVIGFVFQFFMPVSVDNYFLFLFAGLLPWNFFSYSVLKTVPSIIFERSLIQKASFPREAIVLSIVLSNAFHFLTSLIIFITFILMLFLLEALLSMSLLSFSFIMFLFRLPLLIPLLVWVLLLTSGLSLLGAALNVRYRDVNFIFSAVMPLWFYATPVVYTLDLLPTQIAIASFLNPLTGIITIFQWILLDVKYEYPLGIFLSILISFIIFIAGIKVFMKESKFFDDWI